MGVYQYGGYGVDVKLHSKTVPSDVYWDAVANSYVLVEDKEGLWATQDGKRVSIVSVNGIGEIRWHLREYEAGDHVSWFNLQEVREGNAFVYMETGFFVNGGDAETDEQAINIVAKRLVDALTGTGNDVPTGLEWLVEWED
jgi:hypothetical protein